MSMDGMTSAWWDVVKTLSGFIVAGHEEEDLACAEIREKLEELGFEEEDIEMAYEWIDRASLSGTLSESLAMLQPQIQGPRLANPLERAYLSEKLWTSLEKCRHKGLMSDDLIERLLEGVRVIDTRDWDDEEVTALLYELLGMVMPGVSDQKFRDILENGFPEFYS